jgi:hypothetical protein
MAPALERAAIVVLLLVLAVGIWDLERGRPSNRPKGPAQVAGVSQTRPPATSAHAPAATTPPPQSPGVGTPVSDNGSLATYSTGRDRFAVVVKATDAPCWVLVKTSPTGPVLFQDTLQAGDSRPFDATGTLWVRVGNLGHTSVLVEGTPLALPDKPSFPYNLLLQK